MTGTASSTHESFSGLAPGASETRPFSSLDCYQPWYATVDDLQQVDETDETNNTRGLGDVVC
jgi:hypothetical protein